MNLVINLVGEGGHCPLSGLRLELACSRGRFPSTCTSSYISS